MKGVAAGLLAGLILVTPAWALEQRDFRYERSLKPAGAGPIRFAADGQLYGHARISLDDLRILDASGRQVPWRVLPAPQAPRPASVRVLNSGRQGTAAVALLDLGPTRHVRERLDLTIPGTGFVGRVQVFGSDDRRTFTHLSTGVIYDIEGAEGRARSTAVTFPPSDFRYLQIKARGVQGIDGATVSGRRATPQLLVRGKVLIRTRRRSTKVDLDLGYPKVPVDELDVSARTPRYDRPATVEGSNDSKLWQPLVSTRVFRLGGAAPTPISVDARYRYLRLTIANGDDEPLRGLEIVALARPRPLLAEGGHPGPLRVLYGNLAARPPSYDFARLPPPKADQVALGKLGPERRNALFEPPSDTRTFAARHPGLVSGALALAALVAAAGGFLALRRRA